MTSKLSDYASLTDLLDRSGSPLQLAELHGGLSGVIAAGGGEAARDWVQTLLDDCSSTDAAILDRLDRELRALSDRTVSALNGLALEFEPLLPDDDAALEPRVEALALWCHGFLAGLAIGGLDIDNAGDRLSAETAELIPDLAEISRAAVDAVEDEDSNLADETLVELIEYVRVGAQLMYDELAARPGPPEQHTIH